jgi:D-tyrosyl-tRNA(Tyr) deacylase
MRAVVQRVSQAEVREGKTLLGRIRVGLVILLAVGKDDQEGDAEYLVEKVLNLRIFEDGTGKMNHSLMDVKGELLIISQFTLYGDCRKGRRPSFSDAAQPDEAEKLYRVTIEKAKSRGVSVASGKFQSTMDVHLVNSGPVTILVDSKRQF